jgi:hypothetical protein
MAYEHEVFPWLKHLGEDGQREFFEEILTISVHSAELGTPLSDYVERLNACVAAWKATAEVHADPELSKVLLSETGFNEDDFVEAERPELPKRVSKSNKLCSSVCPPNWCNLTTGHTGVHRSRSGNTWTDEDARRARYMPGYTPQVEIRDEIAEIKDFPGPRHGE